ncbi:MAG TPA: energy transducer TonB [Thermoanaerobaculia bacterium]|nr:energy transducer TonB [Thermoanaerobaculia bacterium]
MPGIFRVSRPSLTLIALILLLSSGVHAQQAPPYRVGGEVTRPEKISGVSPVYTEVARKARVMGVVIVEAVIDEQGSVTETRVLKGLPMGLDRAAVEAVETWKFKPATLEGKPVPVYYILTVNFQLDTTSTSDLFSGRSCRRTPNSGSSCGAGATRRLWLSWMA